MPSAPPVIYTPPSPGSPPGAAVAIYAPPSGTPAVPPGIHSPPGSGIVTGVAQVETLVILAGYPAGALGYIFSVDETDVSTSFDTLGLNNASHGTINNLAAALRAAIPTDSYLNGRYVVSGTGANVVITRRFPYLPNDPGLSISLRIYPSGGGSTLTTSTHTTAGVATLPAAPPAVFTP